MDFTPPMPGNMKGCFNRTPTPEDMRCWAERQGAQPAHGDRIHGRHRAADRAVPRGQRPRGRHRLRIADWPRHLPICLVNDLHVRRKVEPGDALTMADVDLAPGPALGLWQGIAGKTISQCRLALGS